MCHAYFFRQRYTSPLRKQRRVWWGGYHEFFWYKNELYYGFENNPKDATVCSNEIAISFIASPNFDSQEQQWQINSGDGFFDLTDDDIYSGVTTDTLTISALEPNMDGFLFRCSAKHSNIIEYSEAASLIINLAYEIDTVDYLCYGNVYSFGTQTLTEAGEYTETFPSANGCDSIVTLTLQVNPTYNETEVAEICNGATYTFGSQTLTESGEYTEVFQSISGCDSTVILTLTVNPVYNESIEASICDGEVYQLGGQELTESGEYTETFESVSGCDSTVNLTLIVNTVDVSVEQDGATLTALATEASYQWATCGDELTPIDGETNQSFTAAENGDYAVIVTQNECVDNSECYSVTGISILENSFNSEFAIYPNPTNGNLTIETKEVFGNIKINIFSLSGQKVANFEFSNNPTLSLDLSDIDNGVYILNLQSDNKTAVFRITKE